MKISILSVQDIKKIEEYYRGRLEAGEIREKLPVDIGISSLTLSRILSHKPPVTMKNPTYNKINSFFKERGIILGEQ